MTVGQHRDKLGKFILCANGGIFILIAVLYALKGLTFDDLKEILPILLPIKAVYMTPLIKYVTANKIETEADKKDAKSLKPLYKSVANFLIRSHIVLLILSISLYAFNQVIMNIAELKMAVAVIEFFFGAYIGIIVTDMFKVEENSN